jgi:hypothetical protein
MLRWFSTPVTTQLAAENVLMVVWRYFLVMIGVVMIADVTMFLWGQSQGNVRGFPLLNVFGGAATLSVVYLMTARRSRSLALVLFLLVLSIAGQSLHGLKNMSSLSYGDVLMISRLINIVFMPLLSAVVSMVNALVMYKAVTATFQYHSILHTHIIWKHVLMLGAVVLIGGLSLSIFNEMMWNALRGPLNLSDYSTEIEGRLNVCWLALTCLVCSTLLASRFPMTKPIELQTET